MLNKQALGQKLPYLQENPIEHQVRSQHLMLEQLSHQRNQKKRLIIQVRRQLRNYLQQFVLLLSIRRADSQK